MVPDDKGRPQALVGIIRDVTERRQAVEEVKERGRLASLTAEVGLALVRAEPLPQLLQRCAEAVARHLEAAFARIWTVDEAEQVLRLRASAGLYTRLDGSRGVVSLANETKIARIARTRQPNLTNAVVGDPLVIDQEWARREGIVAFAGYPLVVEDRVMGVIAMFARRPLTVAALQAMESVANTVALGIVRNNAETALRDNEERFRRIFEEGPLGMALLGLDQRIVRVNEALCEMVGRKARELVGRAPAELAPPDGPGALPEALGKLLAGEIPRFGLEERWLRQDGQTVWLRLSASALHDPAGRPRLGLVMVEDVTEQKIFEMQLRQAKERAEAAERTKSEFLHIASHELRTPLNALNLNIETLRHRLARERPIGPELVDRLMHQVRRLSYMVGDLLDSSRLERGELVIRKVALDLSTLVASTVQDFRGIAPDRQVSLILPGPTVTIDADPTRIEQVVANLLDNALKYSPLGAPVEVQLATDGTTATLTVTDHGVGIPDEDHAKLFTRFFRVTSDTTRYQPGLGLGLYICNVIVESHGGTIRVDSQVGHGTTFVVTLPIEGPAAEAPALAEPTIRAS
jgi:PAS domain S-box-containing protein